MTVKITSEESLAVEKAFVDKEVKRKLLNFLMEYYPSKVGDYAKRVKEAEENLTDIMSPIGEKYTMPGYNLYTFDFDNEVIYYE
jgi:predicted transcriptional regulator with HTH domain